VAPAVRILATPELEATDPSIDRALKRLQDSLNALPPDELVAVVEAATRALPPVEEPLPAVVTALTGGRRFSAAERAEAEVDLLRRSFARRRKLLADALSASEVAALLGTTRQTPHDRLASGTLLAVMDRGAYRFPRWQFDPDGEDGVVRGLPAVIRALDVSPLAKLSWLTRANPMLDGRTPLACLQAGEVERVVPLARAVGIA
jgi:excisionase family DNA binding protein